MRLGPLGFHGMVGVRRPRPEHAPLSRLASASRASRWFGLAAAQLPPSLMCMLASWLKLLKLVAASTYIRGRLVRRHGTRHACATRRASQQAARASGSGPWCRVGRAASAVSVRYQLHQTCPRRWRAARRWSLAERCEDAVVQPERQTRRRSFRVLAASCSC